MFQNNQADDYHVFVTDSEWMRELGLATFTTGTLYDWWYHRGRGNRFINRPLVLGGASKTPYESFFMGARFTPVAPPRTPVWRFTGLNKGKYKDMAFDSSWNYTDGRPVDEKKPWYNASYDAADADLSAFDGSKFVAGSAGGLWGGVGLLSPPRLGGDPDPTDAGLGTDTNSPTNIIACNDWLRDWEVKAPDKTDQTMWSVTDLAAYRFIQDIKTSKSGCLIYPVSMTFDVAPGQTFSDGAGGLVPAYKTEEFTIKLFLYDEKSVRKSGRTAILTSTKHAAVPRDAMGRVGKKEDGEIDDVDGTDPSNKVVGDIDLTLNTTTGEWYSGSKQMLARISQEVPAADWECTTDDLKLMEITEILDDPNDPRHLVMGTGLAMPISMQNGNPMQWTPNYIDPKDCRQDGREKFTVIVHNPDPDRSFPKDKVVLLNQIDGGPWLPMEFGEGPPTGADAIEGNFEGRWDFIYFATSLEYFFRDGDNNVITPEQAERAFHVQYYANFTAAGAGPSTLNWALIAADNPHPSIRGATPFLGSDAYHQFSSFDFMDDNVAGTRGPMRSLGATVYGKDPLGGNTTTASENTGPFFGCVFPNGYSAGGGDRNGANTYNASRNWQVLGLQPRSIVRGKFFNAAGIPSIGAAGAPHMAFKDGANGMDLTRHAYNQSPGNADGNIIPMFADVAKGNFDVPHLPADIALNASPSGENGRPLTNLNSITSAVHGSHLGQVTQNLLRDEYWPSSKNWLYKAKYWDGSKPSTISYDSTAGSQYTHEGSGAYDDSAFDFKPKVNNKIQFRPLKMEVYASLVDDGKTTAHNRENVWYHVRDKMSDATMPASVISRNRELGGFFAPAKNPLYGDGGHDHQSSPAPGDEPMWGLKFNVDYPLSLFATNDPSDMFSDADSWKQDIVGGQAWRHSFTEPAGAVGVIGAIATVSAADHVNFTTQQSIGTDADYGGTVGGVSFGDFQILGPKTNWNATWGGGSLDYDNFHTTDLSVRIYQAWPRDQTIYDSRYFAVHHFNDGVKLSQAVKRDPTDTYGDGQHDHKIARAESTVDIREPSYVYLGDQLGPGVQLTGPATMDADIRVFKDIADNGLSTYVERWPILPTGMWNINPIRRGKLLPFRYSYEAITIPWPESLTVFGVTVFPLKLLSGAGVYHSGSLPQGSLGSNYIDPSTSVEDVTLVVQNLGKDYQIGDRFTVLGSDCLLEVLTVDDYINAGQVYKNSIKEFKVTDLGTYLDHPNLIPMFEDNTLSVKKPIHSFTQGAAKIEPLNSSSAAGTGFAAYVVQGKVSTLIGTDDKPKIATEEDFYQLSLPAANFGKESREHDQMVVGNRSVDANIDPDKVSSDGMYDLFFHFHNDISHTWLSKGDWGTYANNEDQYIDLTINPV
jgi:hypothetical protein